MRGLLKGGVFYVLVWEGMWSPVRYYVTGGLSLVRCFVIGGLSLVRCYVIVGLSLVRCYVIGLSLVRCCVTGGFTVLRDEYFELFTVSFFLVLIKPPL